MTSGSANNSSNSDSFSNKYKHLTFLDNASIVERKSISRINEDSQCSYQETEELESDSHNDVEESGKTSSITSRCKRLRMSQERTAVAEEFKKEHIERSKICKELLESDKPRRSESAISMFFCSIAATVEQFRPTLQTKAKVEVMKVISQLEYENHEINARRDIEVCSATSF